jgi:hypothetical protein
VTANLTPFRDEELDADLAAILGHGSGPGQGVVRSSVDRRYISLGSLLSSRQASTTIGFSLVIVFAVSATVAVLYKPGEDVETSLSNAVPRTNAPSTRVADVASTAPPPSGPSAVVEARSAIVAATPPAHRKPYSTAITGGMGKKPIQRYTASGASSRGADLTMSEPGDVQSSHVANGIGNVAPPADNGPPLMAAAVTSSVPPQSDASVNTNDLAVRARRDSVAALRSLRRQW